MFLQPAADYAETPGVVSSTSLHAALPRNVVKMQPFALIDGLDDALGAENHTIFIGIGQLRQDFLQLLCRILFGSFLSPAAKYIISMVMMMVMAVLVVMVMMMLVVVAAARRVMALPVMVMMFMFMLMLMFVVMMVLVVVTAALRVMALPLMVMVMMLMVMVAVFMVVMFMVVLVLMLLLLYLGYRKQRAVCQRAAVFVKMVLD